MTKGILLLFILLINTEIAVRAQGNERAMKETVSPEAKAQEMVSRVYSACSPAGYQANRISRAFTDYYSQLDVLMHQSSPGQADFEMKRKMLKDNLNERLQTILTPEQMSMWASYKGREKIDL